MHTDAVRPENTNALRTDRYARTCIGPEEKRENVALVTFLQQIVARRDHSTTSDNSNHAMGVVETSHFCA